MAEQICTCKSNRIMRVTAKCSDLCDVSLDDRQHDGYVPNGLNIGRDKFIMLKVCASCGHLFGKWPLPANILEESSDEELFEDN